MTRRMFMEQLEKLLVGVPVSDRSDALLYYSDYFDEAGIEEDMIVPESVGTPEQIAKRIMKDSGVNNSNNYYGDNNKTENNHYYYGDVNSNNRSGTDNTVKILVAVLIAVVTFPIWSGIGIAVLSIILGIVVGLAGAIIGLGVAGVALMVAGIASSVGSVAVGVLLVGTGMLLLGIAILLVIPEVLFCGTFMPWLVNIIIKGVKSITDRKENIV